MVDVVPSNTAMSGNGMLKRRMQGNCVQTSGTDNSFQQTDGTVPLRDLAPGQCLVLANESPFTVTGKLWLEGLYFRRHSPSSLNFAIGSGFGAELWLTNVVIQGSGSVEDTCHTCGIDAASGPVSAKGEMPVRECHRRSTPWHVLKLHF